MKVLFFKSVLVLGIAGICLDSSAQNKPKPKPKTTTNAPQRKSTAPATDPFGNPIGGGTTTPNKPPATVKPKPGATNGGAAADPFAPSGGSTAGKDTGIKGNGGIIPIVVIPSKAGNNPLTDSSKASQRKDNGAEENHLRDRTPLEYDLIREDDAVYKQRLWKVIDAREKMNQVFKNSRVEDNGSQLFFVILFKAVTEGGITAFEDDRFTTPISKERFMRDYSGGLDTSDVPSLDNADVIVRREVRSREFPVDSGYHP